MRIGLFDSGIGGFTVLDKIIETIGGAEIIYVADTLRAPYGTKPIEVLKGYLIEIVSFLLKKDVDMIISACNTLDSVMKLHPLKLPVPYVSIIDSAVELAKSDKVSIIGTEATVKMGIYSSLLGERLVLQKSAQVLVSAVESGIRSGKILDALIRWYTLPIHRSETKELILACTHFPVYRREFERILDRIRIIDPADGMKLKINGSSSGFAIFYVTGDVSDFSRKLKSFGFHRKINYTVERLDVESLIRGRIDLEEDSRDIGAVGGW